MKSRVNSARNIKGVVAIEFAIGIFLFLGMIFYWMEVSYLGFVTAMVDYAVADSSRQVRSNPDAIDYKADFKLLLKRSDSGWAQFVDAEKFTMGTVYFESVGVLKACESDFNADECKGSADYINKPIAIYRVTYPYQPLFYSVMGIDFKSFSITREVISIQEYQRQGGSL